MARVWSVIAAFALACAAPGAAQACVWEGIDWERAHADFDFVALVSVESRMILNGAIGPGTRVRIVERWKGPDRSHVQLRIYNPFGCGPFPLVEGQGYLVLANETPLGLVVADSTRVQMVPGRPDSLAQDWGEALALSKVHQVLGRPAGSLWFPITFFLGLPGVWALSLALAWAIVVAIRRPRWAEGSWQMTIQLGQRVGRQTGTWMGVAAGMACIVSYLEPISMAKNISATRDVWGMVLIIGAFSILGAIGGGTVGAVIGRYFGGAAAAVALHRPQWRSRSIGMPTGVAAAVLGVWAVEGSLYLSGYLISMVCVAALAGKWAGRRLEEGMAAMTDTRPKSGSTGS